MNAATTIAVLGGTAIYELPGLTNIEEHEISTPFGPPSDVVVSGLLGGDRLLFLPRHGRGHRLLPSEINYRANIFALKSLGAEWCVAISAVGSLREELAPGDIVVPDQLIDRTRNRQSTFFGEGVVAHVAFADPFCPVLRGALLEALDEVRSSGSPFSVGDAGTYLCMEGPAFSTRAESFLYRSWGASIIGMTALPEAKLAREAEIAYATLALVTDYDCWRNNGEDVDVSAILAILKKNGDTARRVVEAVIPKLSSRRPSALASHALDNAILTPLEKAPRPTLERLRPILKRVVSGLSPE